MGNAFSLSLAGQAKLSIRDCRQPLRRNGLSTVFTVTIAAPFYLYQCFFYFFQQQPVFLVQGKVLCPLIIFAGNIGGMVVNKGKLLCGVTQAFLPFQAFHMPGLGKQPFFQLLKLQLIMFCIHEAPPTNDFEQFVPVPLYSRRLSAGSKQQAA